jgi:hypothetical protein
MSDSSGSSNIAQNVSLGGAGQPFSRAQDYKAAYAGNFRFRVTNTDAAITFLSVADFPGGMVALQDEATITMSFGSLKILSEHLALAVQTIEQELGPIRVPVAIRPSEQNKAMMIQALKSTPLAE